MIIRCEHSDSVSIDKGLVFNKKLSAEARLLLIMILSYDDDHRFNVEEMVKESGLTRYKIDKTLKELKENKYLQYKHISVAGRYDGVEWIIKENPYGKVKEKPHVDNDPIISGEIITTEQFNFEQFWSKYPKKVNRDKALKEFMKIPDVNTIFPDIMRALEIQINSKQWREEGGRYIPSPENYLKKEGWNNVIDNTQTVDEVFRQLEERLNEADYRNI